MSNIFVRVYYFSRNRVTTFLGATLEAAWWCSRNDVTPVLCCIVNAASLTVFAFAFHRCFLVERIPEKYVFGFLDLLLAVLNLLYMYFTQDMY